MGVEVRGAGGMRQEIWYSCRYGDFFTFGVVGRSRISVAKVAF